MLGKTIKISRGCLDNIELNTSLSILEKGGIVLYPTDTLYGLAVNIYDDVALKKVYTLKKRSTSKPLSVCLSNIEEIPKVAKTSTNVLDKISKLLPGPYTILLEKNEDISNILTANSDKIGIRIPDNKICQQLSSKFPITTTSANISNHDPEVVPELILNQLKGDIDLVLDVGLLNNHEPSTIIDFTLEKPRILRKGIGLNNLKNKL